MSDITRPGFNFNNPAWTVSGSPLSSGTNVKRRQSSYRTVGGKRAYVQPYWYVRNDDGDRGLWDIDRYKKLSQEEFDAVMTNIFGYRFGVSLVGFTVNELSQIQYIYESLSLVNLPMKKLNRVFKRIKWDVKDKLTDVTATYEKQSATLYFSNVVATSEIHRRFAPEKLDTSFSEAIFYAIGQAVDYQLNLSGMVSDDDRNLFARLCGWNLYSDIDPTEYSLITPYAQANPKKALAEYFGNYITHQKNVHEMLSGDANTDTYVYIYSDEIVRDIRPEYTRFQWLYEVIYSRFIV